MSTPWLSSRVSFHFAKFQFAEFQFAEFQFAEFQFGIWLGLGSGSGIGLLIGIQIGIGLGLKFGQLKFDKLNWNSLVDAVSPDCKATVKCK